MVGRGVSARRWRGALLGGILALSPLLSHAVQLSDDLILNGFFTLEASESRGGDSNFPGPTSLLQLNEGDLVLSNSVIGLQADYAINPELRLVLQGVFGKQKDGDYDPSLEWAYLSYDRGNDLTLRAGKFKPPFLQGTELRQIGFSRLWARPLIPSNGTAGFDRYLGAEFIKNSSLGDYNLTTQGAYGVAEHLQSNIENDDIKILSLRLEKNESWLKLALFHAQYDIWSKDNLYLQVENTDVLMGSMETELLLGNSQINLGYVSGDGDNAPDEQMAYLSLGQHMGRFTPYLLYQNRSITHSPLLPPPPPGAPPPAPVKDGTEKTNSYSLGMRFDLTPKYAIKAQVEHQELEDSTDPAQGTVQSDADIFTLMFEGVF